MIRVFAVLFLLVVLACSLWLDLHNSMWTDEILTLLMARQGSPRAIADAILAGADGAPPAYATIVSWLLPFTANDPLAARLPSTAGFCVMLTALYAFCRRRLPVSHASAAVLLACLNLMSFATQARAYGLVLGCAAGAMLAWQSVAEGRRRTLSLFLLAFCLALATALHYYSVILLVPLALGELVRWRQSGRPDWPVAAAFAAVLPVLALHYPFIAAQREFLPHFWSPARWAMIPEFYQGSLGQCLALAILPMIVLVCLPGPGRAPWKDETPLHERVMIGALMLTPALAVAAAQLTTRTLVFRYVVWAGMGIAVGVVALLCRWARGRAAVGWTLVCAVLPLIAFREVSDMRRTEWLVRGEAIRRELRLLPPGGPPVVVASHDVYLELWQCWPEMRPRLLYPLSRELNLRYENIDTGPLLMAGLTGRAGMRIVPLAAVLQRYPEFILAADPPEYLPRHLAASGYRVEPLAGSNAVLFRVTAPESHQLSAGNGPARISDAGLLF